MTTESTHPSLLERLRDLDDQVAWREFDERYREVILRYAGRRGLQPVDAEDIRQLAIMAIAKNVERFRYRPEVGRFRDYLRTIVKNLIRRHLATRGRSPERPMSDALDAGVLEEGDRARDEAWEEEWRLHHYRVAMRAVRRSLQPKTLSIFDALLAGKSVDEVAGEFETSPDVVYKAKQRVRERLKEQVSAQIRDETLSRK